MFNDLDIVRVIDRNEQCYNYVGTFRIGSNGGMCVIGLRDSKGKLFAGHRAGGLCLENAGWWLQENQLKLERKRTPFEEDLHRYIQKELNNAPQI